jgi:hypothetical protein
MGLNFLVKCVTVARFGVLTPVKIQVGVFWIVTVCSVMVGYQRFRGLGCLLLYPENGGSKVTTQKIST